MGERERERVRGVEWEGESEGEWEGREEDSERSWERENYWEKRSESVSVGGREQSKTR